MDKVSRLTKRWLGHRRALEDLLDAIPEGSAGLKPWEGALSLAEVAGHAASSSDFFATVVQTGELVRGPKLELTTMEEVRSAVREATVRTLARLESLTEEQLDASYDLTKVFGVEMKGKTILQTMTDHEIHHKGQLFVYARIAGAETVPSFVKRA